MQEKHYSKPQLMELSDDEMMETNGGVGAVAVVPWVGLAVGAVLVAGAYSVLAGGIVEGVLGAATLVLGANWVVTSKDKN